MDNKDKLEQIHGMVSQLVTMVAKNNQKLVYIEQGSESMKQDLASIHQKLDVHDRKFDAHDKKLDALVDDVSGLRGELRFRLDSQRSAVAKNTEDIAFLGARLDEVANR